MTMEKETAVLSANIQYLRAHNRLTKTEMARIMGVGLRTLSMLENGEMPKKLKCTALLRLARHFHLPVGELLTAELTDYREAGDILCPPPLFSHA